MSVPAFMAIFKLSLYNSNGCYYAYFANFTKTSHYLALKVRVRAILNCKEMVIDIA